MKRPSIDCLLDMERALNNSLKLHLEHERSLRIEAERKLKELRSSFDKDKFNSLEPVSELIATPSSLSAISHIMKNRLKRGKDNG